MGVYSTNHGQVIDHLADRLKIAPLQPWEGLEIRGPDGYRIPHTIYSPSYSRGKSESYPCQLSGQGCRFEDPIP